MMIVTRQSLAMFSVLINLPQQLQAELSRKILFLLNFSENEFLFCWQANIAVLHQFHWIFKIFLHIKSQKIEDNEKEFNILSKYIFLCLPSCVRRRRRQRSSFRFA